MKKTLILLSLLLVFTPLLFSQEFKIQVNVSTTIQGTDRKIYEDMQKAINEFINNRNWTDYNYKIEEKIEGSISINIKECFAKALLFAFHSAPLKE